ncbi:hypothetical protein ID866_3286 [Astraeus odoratus]|nr:hypothetical protein ID866_3286 [Astraeus odoratus]
MPARMDDDDWSDSDEEFVSGVETDVLLGVPDGSVDNENDMRDAAVSRIGGLPTVWEVGRWYTLRRARLSSADLSVRAWRALKYNSAYAEKLEKKKARKDAKEKVISSLAPPTSSNPFAMQASTSPSPFGLGDQIFGQISNDAPHLPSSAEEGDQSDAESEDSSEDSLITAMASTTIQEPAWTMAPSYPPVYLSTMVEYIPPAPKPKLPPNARIDEAADEKGGKDASWGLEAYENMLKVDATFDRFTKRISHTAEQCLRYDLKGTPLPFASDKIFESLFPAPQDPLPVTRAAFKVVPSVKRSYTTSSVPRCPVCKSGRVFECQLMPNLINILRDAAKEKDIDFNKLTNEQRIKAVQDALKRSKEPDSRGMEWGTCMVFSCEKDCCLEDDGKDAKEAWREEYVLVQWDE